MRQFVYDSWNSVMDADKNPLRHIPDQYQTYDVTGSCVDVVYCVFMWVGSFWVMGASMIGHAFILAAIVVTVATFETAKRKPNFFNRFPTSTPSRARDMWINGKKIKLDPQDKGGEHE